MTNNIQQELMARITSEILEESMFKTWHKVIFREIIALSNQQIPLIYGKFTEVAADFISDLINTMCLLDSMRMSVYVPIHIDDTDAINFWTAPIKTVQNIASVGYTASDVNDVAQFLTLTQVTDSKRSRVKLRDFVPYRLCNPTMVIDPITFLPAMDLSLTYCYRIHGSNKCIHPTLLDRV